MGNNQNKQVKNENNITQIEIIKKESISPINNQNSINQNLNKKSLSKINPKDIFTEVTPSSEIEKLPKVLLSQILTYLPMKELAKMIRLNKYFLNLILLKDQIHSKKLWKTLFVKEVGDVDESILERECEEMKKDQFESFIDKYYLIIKYDNQFVQKDSPKYNFKRNGRKFEIEQICISFLSFFSFFFHFYQSNTLFKGESGHDTWLYTRELYPKGIKGFKFRALTFGSSDNYLGSFFFFLFHLIINSLL